MVDRVNLENVGWGLAFILIGLGFVTEQLGWWQFESLDLGIIGPLALVIVGLVVAATSFATRRT